MPASVTRPEEKSLATSLERYEREQFAGQTRRWLKAAKKAKDWSPWSVGRAGSTAVRRRRHVTKLPDGSLLVGGKNADSTSTPSSFHSKAKEIRSVRIERWRIPAWSRGGPVGRPTATSR